MPQHMQLRLQYLHRQSKRANTIGKEVKGPPGVITPAKVANIKPEVPGFFT